MNKRPVDQAHDRDLRLSQQAMKRAAQHAHDLAISPDTAIVVSRNGVIEHLTPKSYDKPTGKSVEFFQTDFPNQYDVRPVCIYQQCRNKVRALDNLPHRWLEAQNRIEQHIRRTPAYIKTFTGRSLQELKHR